MTTMTPAETASSPPETHAAADDRDPRRREPRRPPRPPPGHGSAADSPAADSPAAAGVPAAAEGPAAADVPAIVPAMAGVRTAGGVRTARSAPASEAPAKAPAAKGPAATALGLPARAPAATGQAATGPDSPSPRNWTAPSSASRRPEVGRLPGCLARQLPTSDCSSSGRSPSSAGLLTSRYISAALVPEPNGPCPVHAKISSAPRLKMSLGGPVSSPRACSGDKNSGEP